MEDTHKNVGQELVPQIEPDKEKLYTEILYQQALQLLGKYLPEACPQEGTEVFIGIMPQYIGTFEGRHCISLERDADLDPMIQSLQMSLRETEWLTEQFKLFQELEDKRFKLIFERAESGRLDFEDIDEMIDQEEELARQRVMPEEPEQTKDWQEPEKLQQGLSQFSDDSLRGVYMLVHELIHQRQAELNPLAFPVLESAELDQLNFSTSSKEQLYDLLIEAHRSWSRSKNKETLFEPVIEGMAVLGTFYVMGRFADDLAISNGKEVADRIRAVRKSLIHQEVVASSRKVGSLKDDYGINYSEGFRVMRRLYKQIGLENMPRALINIDLKACQQITKGSLEYQKIIENPALIPGLHVT